MELIALATSKTLLDAVAASIGNSTAVALPTQATQLTWQTSFGSASASITIQLQTSNDNATWSTIDTSTSTTGESKSVSTSALFLRARINAASGGSGVTVTVVPKAGYISTSALSPTFTNLTVTNQFIAAGLSYPLADGSASQVLSTNGSGTLSWVNPPAGNPASPDTSVQFNSGGIFGGSVNLEWKSLTALEPPTLSLYFGTPFATTIGSNILSIQPSDTLSGSVTQPGSMIFGYHNMSMAGFNITNEWADNFLGCDVTTDGGHLANGVHTLQTGLYIEDGITTGGLGNAYAINSIDAFISHYGGTTDASFSAVRASVGFNGGTCNNFAISFGAGITSNNSSGGFLAYSAFYAPSLASITQNPYYAWFDSQGVYRIKEDSTFDSVGQAIPALYNPQFTKYTPGAVNFERVVEYWSANVATLGVEKGGSGTVRDLNLVAAHIQHNGHVGISTTITTGSLVGKTITIQDGLVTGFA